MGSSEIAAINVEYHNEIKRLREMNRELIQRIHDLEQAPSAIEEAYNDELVRNAELEEVMTRQRRNNLSLRRRTEAQSAEISILRERCRELKRQTSSQRKLIERQQAKNTKSEARLKFLRELLIEKEPSFAAKPSMSLMSSLDFTVDSVDVPDCTLSPNMNTNTNSTNESSVSPYWCTNMQSSFSLDTKPGVPRVASYHSMRLHDS